MLFKIIRGNSLFLMPFYTYIIVIREMQQTLTKNILCLIIRIGLQGGVAYEKDRAST